MKNAYYSSLMHIYSFFCGISESFCNQRVMKQTQYIVQRRKPKISVKKMQKPQLCGFQETSIA